MFSGCTVLPDSKEIELEVATKRLLSISRKQYRGSFSTMFAHGKCIPTAISSGVDILRSLGVRARVTKITARGLVSHEFTQPEPLPFNFSPI